MKCLESSNDYSSRPQTKCFNVLARFVQQHRGHFSQMCCGTKGADTEESPLHGPRTGTWSPESQWENQREASPRRKGLVLTGGAQGLLGAAVDQADVGLCDAHVGACTREKPRAEHGDGRSSRNAPRSVENTQNGLILESSLGSTGFNCFYNGWGTCMSAALSLEDLHSQTSSHLPLPRWLPAWPATYRCT